MRSHDTDADEDAGNEHLATTDAPDEERVMANEDDEFEEVDEDGDDDDEDAAEDTDADA